MGDAVCLITNCNRPAPATEPFCSIHRDKPIMTNPETITLPREVVERVLALLDQTSSEEVVSTAKLLRWQKDAGLPFPPTPFTYQLRSAVEGHRKDEFLSWGYQWEDKPHRLVYAACGEIEALHAALAQLKEAMEGVSG